ncbi:ubiquinol oxidase subunit II [Brevibacillus sp. DP1.3A]|uniref:ubiquinol oxidase subunit II n=1 Tax=Brevibacillus sp. DP1.3A TaxID=2738867 RepID=UPI00156AE8DA|nr:ubiquinol oxidase subunit II [Brevibacillus sp. DP1.3A]MED1918377.1 ubiquinol oxidase subunit II [Bacillus thuringiensis]UED75732.1 ubiquinol oxidase subunit II [Brevibacillus sp. DP1.3A]
MKTSKTVRCMSFLFMFILLFLTTGCADNYIVLDPKGPIGEQQKDLMILSTLLTLIVIVPVLILTFVIVWRYRDRKGRKAKYTPNWEHSTKLEIIWWGIPIIIITLIGIVTVRYTYSLEPSKPLESEKKPITIQVTNLDWKWLFQYPEQGIATVNYVQFPEDVPVRFEVTSDAPMNSFWIPQLGGQIYAMSGMSMTLYLQADEQGEYMGSGANFTGKEFAKMFFTANATSQEDFDQWVNQVKNTSPELTLDGYKELTKQGTSDARYFSAFPEGLYEMTVTKYAASHNHGLSTRVQPPARVKE